MLKNAIRILMVGLFIFALEIYLTPSFTPKYHHRIIFIKWNDDITNSQLDKIKDLWSSLPKRVSGFESFEINKLDSAEYDHMVILKFESMKSYNSYLKHKDRKRLLKTSSHLICKKTEFQYWK